MALATLADYEARHGQADDEDKVTLLLADAESLVREVAGLTIELVEDEEVTLAGDGSGQLLLPEYPVVDVASVLVDGVTLATSTYEWWEWGAIDRLSGGRFTRGPRTVTVTYSHGWDPVPGWITALVCGMVKRSLLDAVVDGVRSESLDDHSVTYISPGSGEVLWLTGDEERRLRALRGPVVA